MINTIPDPERFAEVDRTLRELGLDMSDGITDPKVARFIDKLFEAEEGE